MTFSTHQTHFDLISSIELFPRVGNDTLEVLSVDGFKTDGTFTPLVIGQCQIVKNAWPAKDVTAAGDLGRFGSV